MGGRKICEVGVVGGSFFAIIYAAAYVERVLYDIVIVTFKRFKKYRKDNENDEST